MRRLASLLLWFALGGWLLIATSVGCTRSAPGDLAPRSPGEIGHARPLRLQAVDPEGRWVAFCQPRSNDELYRLDDGSLRRVARLAATGDLAITPAGDLFILSFDGGLFRYRAGSSSPDTALASDDGEAEIRAML